MAWPSADSLQRIKLALECVLLVILLGLLLHVASHDRARAAMFGLSVK
jgi:hypothetical protein